MSIGPPIPEIQHFQSLTLKIQGQGHRSRSQSRYNTLSTHIPFVPCQSALPFLGYSYFKIWPWKSRVKVISEVKVESHNEGTTFDSHPFHPMSIGHPIPELGLKIWLWKSRVKVMGEVTLQSHNVGVLSYRLTSLSCHVNRASHSSVTTFSKIWPWKSRVKVMGEVTLQSHNVGLTPYRLTSLSFHVNRASHSYVTTFTKFDQENQRSRSWVRSHFKVKMGV